MHVFSAFIGKRIQSYIVKMEYFQYSFYIYTRDNLEKAEQDLPTTLNIH